MGGCSGPPEVPLELEAVDKAMDAINEPSAVLPEYSVVIPTWQGADFIEGAVRTALDQTVAPREVIVVNDGSTDDTAARVAALAEADARVATISIENRGVAGARNVGIGMATAPWIAFLDDDDRWHVDKSERQLTHLARHPELVAVGGQLRYSGRSGSMRGVTGLATIGPFEIEKIRAGCLMPFPPSSMIVSRAALDHVGGFDVALSGVDDLVMIAALTELGSIDIVEGELGWYRLHGSAISSTRFRDQRQLSRFVAARIAAHQSGGDLTLDEFVTTEQLSRAERRRERADFHFRRTAVHISEGSMLRAVGAGVIGVGLAPFRNTIRLTRKVKR
jgi:glycosyltransferase involved in cell wall biosynthesis